MGWLARFGRWLAGDNNEKVEVLEKAAGILQAVVAGQNAALAHMHQSYENEHAEKLLLLAALALQAGGEMVLPKTFIEAVSNGRYALDAASSPDGQAIVFRLRLKEPEAAPDGTTPPFQPAEAATQPPTDGPGTECPACNR